MIQTRALTKDFVVNRKTTVRAVRGISLDIAPGELVAVLGPNGAGKTTTLRMLTTLIAPTSGTAIVAGHDVSTQAAAVRREIGYVGQGNGAGHIHRVADELRTQGRIYGMDARAAARRTDELLEALDLGEQRDRKVSDLSGGQRRRLDVAIGLVHAPRLLFLDEPSTGLDPQNRANLWQHILRMREAHGMTIVLTTHYLDEADTMAERVVVVDHGEVIADDTASALKAKLAGDKLLLTGDLPLIAKAAAGLAGMRDLTETSDTLTFRVNDGPAALPELIAAVPGAVRTAEIQRPTLDDVFLSLTGRNLRENA